MISSWWTGGHKVGLDAVRAQPLQVLDIEGRRRIHDHPAPGGLHLGIVHMGAFDIVRQKGLCDVPECRPSRHGDEFRLRVQLREHVARVVIEPLGLGILRMWRERDRPAHLEDHFRHCLLEASDEVVVLVEVGRTLAGLRIAHVHVQHRGAGIVAIDCSLDFVCPR